MTTRLWCTGGVNVVFVGIERQLSFNNRGPSRRRIKMGKRCTPVPRPVSVVEAALRASIQPSPASDMLYHFLGASSLPYG